MGDMKAKRSDIMVYRVTIGRHRRGEVACTQHFSAFTNAFSHIVPGVSTGVFLFQVIPIPGKEFRQNGQSDAVQAEALCSQYIVHEMLSLN